MSANNEHPVIDTSNDDASQVPMTAEQLISEIVARNGKRKTFLGLSLGDLVKFAIVIVVAVGSAYLGIRSGIEGNAIAVQRVADDLEHHDSLPIHPEAADDLEKLDGRLDVIERTTDRIEVQQIAIEKGIGEIKVEIRDQRRRRNRGRE